MNSTERLMAASTLTLNADKAAELMTANPVSVRQDAPLREALALLIDKGYSAAPVIDDAGRPVGVLSRSDILIHDRETADSFHKEKLDTASGDVVGKGFQVEKMDQTRVGDVMTPTVFSIAPDDPAHKAIQDMLALNVHRLFVVDHNGILVGVISAFDVLRRLRP